MRPLELSLTAFRSYASETVDFRRHDLVVISGDTGAGKTSLLDAIAFALYGRTPEQSSPRELLTLGARHGEVRLTFEASGGTWRVTRRLGADAPEPAHLLEALDAGGEVTDHVVGAAAVNATLVGLIGMGFQAFTSAVLLAQGRFAQFLQTSPRDRDVILRELFGVASLEAVRVAAAVRKDAAEREVAVLARERDLLPEHTGAARNSQAALARAAAARHAGLTAIRPLVDAAEVARAQGREAETAVGRVKAALADLPEPDERQAMVEEHATARRAASAARAASDEAQQSMRDTLDARERLYDRHGGTAAELAALRGLAEREAILREAVPAEHDAIGLQEAELTQRRAQLGRLRADASAAQRRQAALERLADGLAGLVGARVTAHAAERRLAEAEARRERARATARRATDEAAVADAALGELRHAQLVATMRASLVAGEPCPVCGQVVHDAMHEEPPDLHDLEEGVRGLAARAREAAQLLTGSEADVRAAAQACDIAAEAVGEAERLVATMGGDPSGGHDDASRLAAEAAQAATDGAGPREESGVLATEVERAAGALAEAHRRLDRDRAELAGLAGRLGRHSQADDPVAALDEAVRELATAEAAVATSGANASRMATRATEADQVLARIEREGLGRLRQSLTVLATRLGLEPVPSDIAATELPVRADDLVQRGELVARDAEERAEGARFAADELEAQIRGRGAPFDVGSSGDFPSRHQAAERALHAGLAELANVEGHASQARRLARDASAAQAEADLFAQLATDLQANRFPRYLLARFHERLAAGASTRLQDLSHGAFSFAGVEPDALAVVDHRRGRRTRGAATLSGGERFLASLALALALADIASGSSGRLDCLFLDEGFSSLDGESLEVAIAGVERMAGDGRLVVVITHLPGVADRLGAEIRVRKDSSGTSHVADPAN
jgi:exonuclease SbcC